MFGNRVALNPGLGGVRDVATAIMSHEQNSIKPSLLFSSFGCCVSKGSLQIIFKLTLYIFPPTHCVDDKTLKTPYEVYDNDSPAKGELGS